MKINIVSASARNTKAHHIVGAGTRNNVAPFTGLRSSLYLLLLAVLLPTISQAQLVVDCTGATPGSFSSINAALPSAGAGTAIFVVAGPCNESLQLAGSTDLFIGTYYGSPSAAHQREHQRH
jgi:hypothetical protein